MSDIEHADEQNAGLLTVAGALLHLGDVEAMLRRVDRYTAINVPPQVFSNLSSVVAELTMISAEELYCYRCGRKYMRNEREHVERTTEGAFKCSPDGPGYKACMRTLHAR